MNTWRFPVLVKHGMVNPAPILKSGLREKSVLQFSFMRWACIQLSAVLSPLKYRRNSLGVLIDIIKILDHILSTFRVFFSGFAWRFRDGIEVRDLLLFVQALSILGYADAAAESRFVHLWCSCFKSLANRWQRCWMCVLLSWTLEEVRIHLNFRLMASVEVDSKFLTCDRVWKDARKDAA
jgi:hypothetical protein